MNAPDRARALIGVPWVHQGRNLAVGLDCIGLLAVVFAGTRYAEHDCTEYGRDPHDGLLERHLRSVFGAPRDDVQQGDVVAMRYVGPIRHVGIVGDHPHGLSLIHTDASIGRVTEHRIDEKWARRIALVFRPESAA